MSTSVLVEGYSISGTAALPINDSYLAARLPYARTKQNALMAVIKVLHLKHLAF